LAINLTLKSFFLSGLEKDNRLREFSVSQTLASFPINFIFLRIFEELAAELPD